RPKKRLRDDDDEAPRVKKRARHEDDDEDDYDDAPKKKKPGKKDGKFSKIVPYRNKPALAAYYCGVFSFIPVLCFLLGPIALILGIFGFLKAQKSPQAHG